MRKEENLSTLASNIKNGIEARMKELHTSMPGIIESVDFSNQTLTVQPAIRRIFVTRDGDKEILVPTDLPILINVPFIYPRGGGYSITLPVAKGDECLLNFSERSIDNWHNTGKVSKPLGKRFHSLSDATAIVGLSSIPNKIENYSNSELQLRKDDGSAVISIKPDSSIKMQNSNGFVELQANGQFNINGVIFDIHYHDQPNDSDGDTQEPTGVPQS